ncbi:hypothetical protein Taro_006043 [Colocasia esculenta]|uniref:Uncharacterized protein n=1 Tax=Colocasia esculenta TaxID=4460 RepID=A0A843TQ04_COLES|nr:hypothetical protein [Colocasia esculenta]
MSTLLDHFFIFWLKTWSIVSTPVWGVSTLPLKELFYLHKLIAQVLIAFYQFIIGYIILRIRVRY